MKGRAAEFSWWVPDAGFELVPIAEPFHKDRPYHPATILLGIAGFVGKNDLGITADAGMKALKAYLEGEALGPADPEHSTLLKACLEGKKVHPVMIQSKLQSWDVHKRDAEGAPGKLYAPLFKYTALFRSFAEKTADVKGFLEFANKYGNLFEDCSLLDWHEEVLAMRRALHIWDLLKHENERALAEHFRWERWRTMRLRDDAPDSEPIVTGFQWILLYDSHPKMRGAPDILDLPTRGMVFSEDPQRPWWVGPENKGHSVSCPFHPASEFGYHLHEYPGLALTNAPDVFLAARFYLARLINERINEHTFSTYSFVEKESVSRSRRGKKLRIKMQMNRVLVPRNLLGALWLQFEHVVTGNKEYRDCQVCGEPFIVAPGERRSDAFYCSNRCRSAERRRLLAEAKQRFRNGESKREIAKAMGMEEKRVDHMLSYQRKERRNAKKKKRTR